MSNEEWSWQFRKPAKRTYDDLDAPAQDRITDKLDEIVTDRWRDPDDYLEPLTGAPHSKLRIGQFRLGAECNHDENILDIYTIEQRGDAYKPGDD
jgi:mRNA interferase RelE/StbE